MLSMARLEEGTAPPCRPAQMGVGGYFSFFLLQISFYLRPLLSRPVH